MNERTSGHSRGGADMQELGQLNLAAGSERQLINQLLLLELELELEFGV
jgi:hypothetical protein